MLNTGQKLVKLSVIIPCYNAAGTIGTQLEALAKQRWSQAWEVIISDNGSTDETLMIVKDYQDRLPNARIVDASARRGQPYALNVGARAAKGNAFVFIDADDEVGFGWVEGIGEGLENHDFVASRFDVEKLNVDWVRESRGQPQRDGLQQYNPTFLPFAGSSGLGVKRALHEAIGGFNEAMPYVFDTDYCFKIQLSGTKLHFVPEALVHIRHRDTLIGIYLQARRWAEYNAFLCKQYRSLGMPTLSWRSSLRSWVRLVRLVPRVHHKGDRARLVRQLGWRIGWLWGNIKHSNVCSPRMSPDANTI